MKKTLLALTICCSLLLSQCSPKSATTTRFDDPQKPFQIQSQHKYVVNYKNGAQLPLSNSDFTYNSFNRTITTKDGKTYSLDQMNNITDFKKGGRNTLKGLGIGAAAGAVLGSVFLGLGFSDSGKGCDDIGDCKAISRAFGILGFASTTIIGSAVGLGIGALTHKTEQTIYQP